MQKVNVNSYDNFHRKILSEFKIFFGGGGIILAKFRY